MDRHYSKTARREAHLDQLECVFRLRTVPSSSDKELAEMEAWLVLQLSTLHARYIWKRDRLQTKLGTVRNEIFNRTK